MARLRHSGEEWEITDATCIKDLFGTDFQFCSSENDTDWTCKTPQIRCTAEGDRKHKVSESVR